MAILLSPSMLAIDFANIGENLKKAEEKMISFAKNTAFILCMFACGFAGLALLLMLLEVLF